MPVPNWCAVQRDGGVRMKVKTPPAARLAALAVSSARMRRIETIHFVGIGGSGMGGIAEVLLNLGYRVQGSDLKPNAMTERLRALGAAIRIGHSAENIDRADVVVVSSAVRGRKPGGADRPWRGACAGGAARRDARRADALSRVDRGGRHARQDHHHQPDRQRAGRGRRGSDLRDRRPAQERRQQRAPGRGPLPGGRSRRERCLVHAPAAGDRGRHQHRQRSPRHHGGDFDRAQAELRRVPAQPAVLRPGGAVRRRRAIQQHPAARQPAVRDLRAARRGRRARERPCARTQRHALQVTLPGRRSALAGDAEHCPAPHNVRNALAAIAVASELGLSRCGDLPRARQLPGHRPAHAAHRRRRASPAATVSIVDDYGHHPTEIAATLEALRQAWPGPPAGAGVPAAPLHAHPRSAGRLRQRARPAPTCCW